MRAAVLHAPRDVRIETRPVPNVGTDDVLVRVGAVGVCASDVHYFTHGRIGRYVVERPLVLGHESAGTVSAVGDGVTSLRVGDRVALEPGIPCRSCAYCKSGRYNLCRDVHFMATPPDDGAFCEYVRWPADFAHRLPDNVSIQDGALIEPFSVGIHAALRGRVRSGETVAILGAGPIGLMVLQAVRASGATTRVVVDLQTPRLNVALAMGATHVLNPTIEDVTGAIKALQLDGADAVFETAGSSATAQLATRLVRPGGRIVWIGLPGDDLVPISVLEIVDKEVDVLGVFRSANVYPFAARLVGSGQVDVRSLVTHVLPLEAAAEALELSRSRANGVLKVVINP